MNWIQAGRFRPFSLLLLGLLLGSPARLAAAPLSQPEAPSVGVGLELVTKQLDRPVYVTHAGDGSGRLFVVERAGRIVVLRPDAPEPTEFLNISSIVSSSEGEQGLFSIAFDPAFSINRRFYLAHTDRVGHVEIARYQVSADNPAIADPSSAHTVLNITKNANRHHGGLVLFGPDGYLYIGVGDDASRKAPNRSELVGKVLRIDVSGDSGYTTPPDNPFVGEPEVRPEIWAYGLRNPWRFSFDRDGGDLYITDVGPNTWEEINLQRSGARGLNFGWDRMSGRQCNPARSACDPAGLEQPIAVYDHKLGCAVIGGHVYRGPGVPTLRGRYVFGDYCSGRIWSLQESAPDDWRMEELLMLPLQISSFGEDEAGGLYLTSMSDNGLYRFIEKP